MAIISACMFAQKSEIELLYAKVVTEDSLVESWVVVEGAYSFRGDPKPLILKELLLKDIRFKDYIQRIHVVEVRKNFLEDFRYGAKYFLRKKFEILIRKLFFGGHVHVQRLLLEKKYMYAEGNSRDSAIPKILDLSTSSNDWILISDLDEILNLSNDFIYKSMIQIMKSNELFHMLYRQKFIFDFDNLDYQQRFTPFINVELLKSRGSLTAFRGRIDGVAQIQFPYVTEYTFCFDLDGLFDKYAKAPHPSPTKESVLKALSVNSMPRFDDLEELRWYKKIDTSDYIIPKYIKDNLSVLKTNIIDDNYELNRKGYYPEIFRDRF
jgi:hypothetical protein